MKQHWHAFVIMCLWISLVFIVFAVARYTGGIYTLLVAVTAIITGAIVTDRILFGHKYSISKQVLSGLREREQVHPVKKIEMANNAEKVSPEEGIHGLVSPDSQK